MNCYIFALIYNSLIVLLTILLGLLMKLFLSYQIFNLILKGQITLYLCMQSTCLKSSVHCPSRCLSEQEYLMLLNLSPTKRKSTPWRGLVEAHLQLFISNLESCSSENAAERFL